MISTAKRSEQREWMDNMSVQGEDLRTTLVTLGKINHRLGGNRVLKKGLKKLLKNHDKSKPIKLLDIGCGDGSQLRYLSKWAKKKGYTIALTGLDGNADCIRIAKELSLNHPEITYLNGDIFEPLDGPYDIVTATLFLHHFTQEQIIQIVSNAIKAKPIGILVNDLHRSKTAYFLFKCVCVFIKNPMIKNDGLISILRGFKRNDLLELSNIINKPYSIKWRLMFRFEWIIYNL